MYMVYKTVATVNSSEGMTGKNRSVLSRNDKHWSRCDIAWQTVLEASTSVPILMKSDQEMRPWECAQTDTQMHWQTDANRFYNLSHAICYSYLCDRQWKESKSVKEVATSSISSPNPMMSIPLPLANDPWSSSRRTCLSCWRFNSLMCLATSTMDSIAVVMTSWPALFSSWLCNMFYSTHTHRSRWK